MRNGVTNKSEPSRFIYDIEPKYFSNPLPKETGFVDDDNDSGMPLWFRKSSGSKFGGYSTRSTGPVQSSGGYGASGGFRFGTGGYKDYGRSGPARPYPSAPASTTRVVPPVAKPDVIDPDFVPVSMTELYEGERVEHNRFGAGIIKEITGTVPELKAVIDFDNYGSKVLLLKYAKLRPEQ